MALSEQEWWETEAYGGRWKGMVDPQWCTSTVVALCHSIEETQDIGLLPILADALQIDAGCDDELLLKFLRDGVVIGIKTFLDRPMGFECLRSKVTQEVAHSQAVKFHSLSSGTSEVIFFNWKDYQDAKRKHYRDQEQCKQYLLDPNIKAALLRLRHPHPSFSGSGKKWWDYACWFTEKRLYGILLRKLKELMKSNKEFGEVVAGTKNKRVGDVPLSNKLGILDWDDLEKV